MMLCALTDIKQIVSVMCDVDLKLRNATPKVAFEMTLRDCQKFAPCLRKYSSYKWYGSLVNPGKPTTFPKAT